MPTDGSPAPAPSPRTDRRKLLLVARKVAVLACLVPALVVVARMGSTLWEQWNALRAEWETQRVNSPVGYVGIYPRRSLAEKPEDWYREEDESLRLWSGWTPGVGHGWFEVRRGEIERGRLTNPLGRDVIPAIDRPLVEIGDGARWRRIPTDALVAGMKVDGVPTAYPILLLEKVEVVNDTIRGRPFLVTYSPIDARSGSIDVYDPDLEGRRVVLGLSGYFYDRKPLLFDRETESLWSSRPEGLEAVAGKRKGARLTRLERPTPVTWDSWRSDNPDSRLIVGSDHKGPRAIPTGG